MKTSALSSTESGYNMEEMKSRRGKFLVKDLRYQQSDEGQRAVGCQRLRCVGVVGVV